MDRDAITTVAADCERYWRAAGLGRRMASEMRQELEAHLAEATSAGRTVESVIGPDAGEFAAAWAAEQRDRGSLPRWDEVFSRNKRKFGLIDVAILVAVLAVAVVAVTIVDTGSEADMDNEVWRWIWVGTAAVFGVGEMLTAGFFLLPFSVGAVVAAVLAFADVEPSVQVIVFLIVSALALVAMIRFVKREDEQQVHAVGANRFVGQTAVVLEGIHRASGGGRVRMETEIWRATTDGADIGEGAEVRVTDVRGARLVVEPVE